MVISSCHFNTTNGLKCAPEMISAGLNFKNFLEVLFCPPLSIFLNETLTMALSSFLAMQHGCNDITLTHFLHTDTETRAHGNIYKGLQLHISQYVSQYTGDTHLSD